MHNLSFVFSHAFHTPASHVPIPYLFPCHISGTICCGAQTSDLLAFAFMHTLCPNLEEIKEITIQVSIIHLFPHRGLIHFIPFKSVLSFHLMLSVNESHTLHFSVDLTLPLSHISFNSHSASCYSPFTLILILPKCGPPPNMQSTPVCYYSQAPLPLFAPTFIPQIHFSHYSCIDIYSFSLSCICCWCKSYPKRVPSHITSQSFYCCILSFCTLSAIFGTIFLFHF